MAARTFCLLAHIHYVYLTVKQNSSKKKYAKNVARVHLGNKDALNVYLNRKMYSLLHFFR